MPSPIRNDWTLRMLLTNTYMQQETRNRFEYRDRDVVRRIRVKQVSVYDGKDPGQARTKFIVESSSYPQYRPYYTPEDSRGRPRRFQRSIRHQYDVVIQLDRLSIDVPFKARVGADRKWDFSPNARPQRDRRTGRVRDSKNAQRGINGDFFFRCSWLWRESGILFGRNHANGPPNQVNPRGIIFAPKHMINVVEQLLNRGVLRA